MKYGSLLLVLLLSLPLSAAYAAEAHVHGEAELSIAFDGPLGKIEFKTPGENLFGFEHAAKSEKDKKTVEETLKKFEENIAQMIRFEGTLACQFSKQKLATVFTGKHHSNIVADYTVRCNKSPLGTTVEFNFRKYFSNLKIVEAQILADTFQKSLKIKSENSTLELK